MLTRPIPRLVVIALLAVLLPATAALPASVRTGVVVGVSGQATLTNPGSDPRPALIGSEVVLGSVIETGPEGRVKLYFERDVVVTCGPATRLTIDAALIAPDGSDSPGVFRLLFGTIRVLVGKILGVENRLDVDTPNGVAGVTGTTLIVRAIPQERSIFLAVDGTISVTGADAALGRVDVSAPQYSVVLPGAAPSVPAPAPAELWQDLLRSTELHSQPESAGRPGQAGRTLGGLPALIGLADVLGQTADAAAAQAGGDDVPLETLVPGGAADADDDDDEQDGDVTVIVDFPE